jgi:glutathione S-transferase
MTQLRLWGQPKSINVQKVLWALDELGLKYERIDAGGSFGRVKEADYLSLNPNGLVPTLEDDGVALWESNAVLRYLFGRYGAAPLQPSDPLVRARADQWTEWYNSSFWPNTRVLLVQLLRTPEAQRDRSVIASARVQVLDAARILDAHLEKQPYVAGDQFTWGDIPLGAAAHRFLNLPIERPEFKAIEAWYARLRQRAPFQKWIDLPLS